MKVYIEISMDNDAFAEDPMLELGRILAKSLVKISDQMNNTNLKSADKLLDINGNTVGTVRLEK